MATPTNLISNPQTGVSPCLGPYIDQSLATIKKSQSSRTEFFNSVGKIGDLEILNSIGAGKIGQGLRILAQSSNAIRTGCSDAYFLGNAIDRGASWVLDHMGISDAAIEAVKGFHPEAANNAWGTAQQVYDQVTSGNFKIADIPGYIQSFQHVAGLASSIFTGASGPDNISDQCEYPPYAVDLIARAPKHKFMFLVHFIPTGSFTAQFGKISTDMAFVVKKSTRPKLKYKTEEVNYYNFRTRVLVHSETEEVNMTFYDDMLDSSFSFYSMVMKALSPISNNEQWISSSTLEDSGMNIPIGSVVNAHNYSASLGVLAGDEKQSLFQEITLYHIFNYGQQVNVYKMFNPKIISITPDDVNMEEGSTGGEIQVSFTYDYLHTSTVPMSELSDALVSYQAGAIYPIQNNDGSHKILPRTTDIHTPYNLSPIQQGCNPLNHIDTTPSK